MILLKSLIVLFLILIIAQLIKMGWGAKNKQLEGFDQFEIYPIAPDENIADELESNSQIQSNSHIQSQSQKAQASAQAQKANDENNTIKDHKRAMNNSQDMSKLDSQIKELLTLSEQAKQINNY